MSEAEQRHQDLTAGRSILDILPPAHIRAAAELVHVWMEQNGYHGRWILGRICSRAHADDAKRMDWLDSFASDEWWNEQTTPGPRGYLRKNIDAEMERLKSRPVLVIGDYVLATKYSDGDPQDQWAVGFYAGVTAQHYDPPRFDVVDSKGKQFRGNGFRRVERIAPERGAWILKHTRDIELSGMPVWHFATCPMDEPNTEPQR